MTGPFGAGYSLGATYSVLISDGSTYVPGYNIGGGQQPVTVNTPNSGGNTFRVQAGGQDRFTVDNLVTRLWTSVFWDDSGSDITLGVTQNAAAAACRNLKVQSQGSNQNGTFECGSLSLKGGDATFGSSGSVEGGHVWAAGGNGNGDTALKGNVAIGGNFIPTNWGGMQGGMFLSEVACVIPTSNPTSGFFIYVDPADHKLKCRGPSGTVTTLANP